MFGLFRSWRRKRYRKRPFPEAWIEHLDEHVPFFAGLEGEGRERFLDNLKIFVWEKHFIEAGGMVITDEVRVVISAAAVRLIHHLDLDFYNRLTEIIVYPTHYHHKDDEEGIIYGEAHHWGTVVLSWEAVLNGLRNPHDGHDTATHEFAHVLDRVDGSFDGTPELRASEHYRAWSTVMTEHYTKLRQRKKKQRRALRQYGATNEAEFFAVATETFFEKPHQLKKQTPDLYEELKRFYGFDPVGEADEAGGAG